jgi:cellulose biosynthesis protein BcsQ
MTRHTKFIAVSNRRGGVGKTTVTMMLAYGLAVVGRQKVLVIDLDASPYNKVLMLSHNYKLST